MSGGKNNLTRLSEKQPLANPFDQRTSKVILQLTDLSEYSGLGQVQLLCGMCIGQVACH